uniref:Uncharacterized protein n=1 Tax=Schistocephalus solidus TaxID=70667 RepID=A0A0X3QDK4_SCHSO
MNKSSVEIKPLLSHASSTPFDYEYSSRHLSVKCLHRCETLHLYARHSDLRKSLYFSGLAEALGLAVWLPSKQKRLIEAAASGGCAICSDLLQRQAPTKAAADLVVADMGKLNAHTLRTELCPSTGSSDHRSLLAWRPTGWTHNSVPKKNTSSAAFSRLPCPKLIQDLADCLSVIHTSFGLTILGKHMHSFHVYFLSISNTALVWVLPSSSIRFPS